MEILIKLTKEKHDLLLERPGTDEAILQWLQSYLNQKLKEQAAEPAQQTA